MKLINYLLIASHSNVSVVVMSMRPVSILEISRQYPPVGVEGDCECFFRSGCSADQVLLAIFQFILYWLIVSVLEYVMSWAF